KPADLLSSLDLAARRHRPVKQSVESRDAIAALQRLHVLEERREAADDFATVQILGDLEELLERHPCFIGAALPEIAGHFLLHELALQRGHHAPLEIGKMDLLRVE